MKHRKKNTMSTRKRVLASAGIIAPVALGAIGIAGYALWHDKEDANPWLSKGDTAFSVTRVGETAQVYTGDENSRPKVTLNATDAAKLVKDGVFAQAIKIDASSNINAGVEYKIALPDYTNEKGAFSDATVTHHIVSSPDECVAGASDPGRPLPIDQYNESLEELLPYKSGTDYTIRKQTQYLCILAKLDDPSVGQYDNTGTVEGVDENGGTVTDSDTWSTNLTKKYDTANEPDHTYIFTPSRKDSSR